MWFLRLQAPWPATWETLQGILCAGVPDCAHICGEDSQGCYHSLRSCSQTAHAKSNGTFHPVSSQLSGSSYYYPPEPWPVPYLGYPLLRACTPISMAGLALATSILLAYSSSRGIFHGFKYFNLLLADWLLNLSPDPPSHLHRSPKWSQWSHHPAPLRVSTSFQGCLCSVSIFFTLPRQTHFLSDLHLLLPESANNSAGMALVSLRSCSTLRPSYVPKIQCDPRHIST